MLLFALWACTSEPGDSSGGDSSLPDQSDNICASGETITLESGYPEDSNTFEWDVDGGFILDGGTFHTEDAPHIAVTCPPCGKDQKYAFMVHVTAADKSSEVVYSAISLVCD